MTTKRDQQMAENMTPDNLSAKDVEAAEKYATILVPLYESGICVEQYTEIDEELKRAYLAGLKAGRVKLTKGELLKLYDDKDLTLEQIAHKIYDRLTKTDGV